MLTPDYSLLTDAFEEAMADPLTACQCAIAYQGEVIWELSAGPINSTTRFWIASAAKPIFSSALWLLIGDGRLDITRPVSFYVPEFSANDKEAITVEQVMLMTSGFPDAPMSMVDGSDSVRRAAQFAKWKRVTEPGEYYAYHANSAHWVLADIIERITGDAYGDFVEKYITEPLGLRRAFGIPRYQQNDIAQKADSTLDEIYDYSNKIAVGAPGSGAAMSASEVALFYQALLHNPKRLWEPSVLSDATSNIRCTLPDPVMNLPANRTLGVVIGNGFGTTWGASKTAFGWPGVGGQIAFAEPKTGLSFSFLQVGDKDQTSQFLRGLKFSNLALAL